MADAPTAPDKPPEKQLPAGCLIAVGLFVVTCGSAPLLYRLGLLGSGEIERTTPESRAASGAFVLLGIALFWQAGCKLLKRPEQPKSRVVMLLAAVLGTALLACMSIVSIAAAVASWDSSRLREFSGSGSFLENKIVWTTAAVFANLIVLLVLGGLWQGVYRRMRGQDPRRPS